MLTYYSRYEECQGVTKYIDFHLESWFTCIKLAGIAPHKQLCRTSNPKTRNHQKNHRSVPLRSQNQSLRKTRLTTRHMAIQKLDIKQELQQHAHHKPMLKSYTNTFFFLAIAIGEEEARRAIMMHSTSLAEMRS